MTLGTSGPNSSDEYNPNPNPSRNRQAKSIPHESHRLTGHYGSKECQSIFISNYKLNADDGDKGKGVERVRGSDRTCQGKKLELRDLLVKGLGMIGGEGGWLVESDKKDLEIALEGCLGILDRFSDGEGERGGFGGGVQGSGGERSDSLCDQGLLEGRKEGDVTCSRYWVLVSKNNRFTSPSIEAGFGGQRATVFCSGFTGENVWNRSSQGEQDQGRSLKPSHCANFS